MHKAEIDIFLFKHHKNLLPQAFDNLSKNYFMKTEAAVMLLPVFANLLLINNH